MKPFVVLSINTKFLAILDKLTNGLKLNQNVIVLSVSIELYIIVLPKNRKNAIRFNNTPGLDLVKKPEIKKPMESNHNPVKKKREKVAITLVFDKRDSHSIIVQRIPEKKRIRV